MNAPCLASEKRRPLQPKNAKFLKRCIRKWRAASRPHATWSPPTETVPGYSPSLTRSTTGRPVATSEDAMWASATLQRKPSYLRSSVGEGDPFSKIVTLQSGRELANAAMPSQIRRPQLRTCSTETATLTSFLDSLLMGKIFWHSHTTLVKFRYFASFATL